MRILCLTHAPFEGPARIEAWAQMRGHSFQVVRADLTTSLPEPALNDFVAVMGGPMSVNDSHTWLRQEAEFLERVLARDKLVLGVCLGAQVLAKILGARVYPSGTKEIGWWPVRRTQTDGSWPLPASFTPLHWHGETFDLPPGATQLAESDAIANQAFSVGKKVLALQFHVEATPESVQAIVEGAGSDIDVGRWQQSAELIVEQRLEHCKALESTCYATLDWLIAAGAPPVSRG
jgi:GMP synthase-like glutamine amidotransferase